MVLVSHIYKFIYLKNYRTASSSIESFFGQYCIDPVLRSSYIFKDKCDTSITPYGIISARCIGFGDDYKLLTTKSDDNTLHNIKLKQYLDSKNDEHAMPFEQIWYNFKSAQYIKDDLGDNIFNEYFKFCVIRNPYDIIVSSYYWDKYVQNIETDFKTYCTNYCMRISNDHVRDNNSRIFIDHIPICQYYIRYENLLEDVKTVLNKLGITDYDINKFPEHKMGFRPQNTHYSRFYDEELKQLVYNTFKEMFDNFNYTFEDNI